MVHLIYLLLCDLFSFFYKPTPVWGSKPRVQLASLLPTHTMSAGPSPDIRAEVYYKARAQVD